MEILADRYKLDNNRPQIISEETYPKKDIVERLIGFITFSEVDRFKAGIYVGNEGRDWIDRSALILSPSNELK